MTERGWLSSLKKINKNLIQIPYDQIESLKTGGVFNLKAVVLRLKTGKKIRLELNTLADIFPGQRQFIEKLQSLYQLNREQTC